MYCTGGLSQLVIQSISNGSHVMLKVTKRVHAAAWALICPE